MLPEQLPHHAGLASVSFEWNVPIQATNETFFTDFQTLTYEDKSLIFLNYIENEKFYSKCQFQ